MPRRSRFADPRLRVPIVQADEHPRVHFVRHPDDERARCGKLMTRSREAPVSWWNDRMCEQCLAIGHQGAIEALDAIFSPIIDGPKSGG